MSDSWAKMTYELVSQSKRFLEDCSNSLVINGSNWVQLVSESFRAVQFATDSLNEQRVIFRLRPIWNESESFTLKYILGLSVVKIAVFFF